MRLDEKENTDFIYSGFTELIGLHTKKPLVLHKSKNEKVSVVTGKDVFPEYYMIYVEKFQDMINEDIDEWVYFFKHASIRDDFKSPGILLAAKKLDYLMMSEEDRRAYDGYLAYLGQELGIIDSAKEEGREEGIAQGIAQGMEQGIAQGMEQGIAQGMEQGIAQGMEQGKREERKELAKKLLSNGTEVEFIIQITGLSKEELEEISKTLPSNR
jgi:predicted transposase/invertase (TIGR01784 family)